jgi:transposase
MWRRPRAEDAGFAQRLKDPCYLVADKGHHSPESLTEFDGAPRTTRIAEPKTAKAYPLGVAPDDP